MDDTKLLLNWLNLLAYCCPCAACTRSRGGHVDTTFAAVTYEAIPVQA